jgi:hypothetical protein
MVLPPLQLTEHLALLQAPRGYVGRVANGVAGYEKFNSPVLLAAGGVIV